MDEKDREIEQLRQMMEENLELSRRNYRIAKRLQASMRRSAIMRAIYWIVIIGSMLGIYYYLQPLFETVSGQYEQLISLPEKLSPKGFFSE